jgi:hypothetical protein
LPFHYLEVGNAEIEMGALSSAVHLEDLSGDVAGGRRGEEGYRRGDLPGPPIRRSGVACFSCPCSPSSVSTISSAEVAAAPTSIALTRIGAALASEG